MINVLDLFSGIGGFTLASSWVGGYRTVGFCEIEGFCRDLLKQNFPGIPIFEDVKELHPEDVIRQREPVHLITAGFPCQDISQAGVQKGIKAERSGLFFEILRLSDEFYAYSGVRPALLLENVANILSGGKGEWARIVHGEVASRGYDCEWKIISAASVGAPHLRKRWWCIAYVANSRHSPDRTKRGQEGEEESLQVINRQEGLSGVSGRTGSNSEVLAYSSSIRCSEGSDFRGEISEEARGTEPNFRDQASGENVSNSSSIRSKTGVSGSEQGEEGFPRITDNDCSEGRRGEEGSQGESEPGLGGVASRIPSWIHEPDIPRVTTEKKNRVKRLKSLGNSIVPQAAMIPLIRFREIYEEQNKI
jgi:DNA (cytosine-5)-methyltransferase 1